MTDEQQRPEDSSSSEANRGEGSPSEERGAGGDRGHESERRSGRDPGHGSESGGYDVEPVGVEPPEPPPGRGGRIDAPGLLDDFDEDADFDDPGSDPDTAPHAPPRPKARLAEAESRRPNKPEADTQEVEHIKPFVLEGLGSARVWAIVGGLLLLGGAIAAGITSQKVIASIFLAIYLTLFHTGTGVAALFVTAQVLGKPFGRIEVGAARMLTAVAAFILVFNLRIDLIGTTKWEELILAAGVYVLWIAMLFRLWGRELGIVLGAHFGLVVLVQFGALLAQWAEPAPAPSP